MINQCDCETRKIDLHQPVISRKIKTTTPKVQTDVTNTTKGIYIPKIYTKSTPIRYSHQDPINHSDNRTCR